MLTHTDYSIPTVTDIVRLRRRIQASGVPPKRTDHNLLICSWNIRAFGGLFDEWSENDDTPKRNLRGLALIAEVIRRFDVIALQEVKRETEALRCLMDDFLGPDWAVILSDVTVGAKGNTERFAYIYDTRRVQPSGLAGEIVLPSVKEEVVDPATGAATTEVHPAVQFARTPYIVGFEVAGQRFSLLTAHIEYGEGPDDRVYEIESLARYTAEEIRDRATDQETGKLIVLGDFNIDKREDNPLFQSFISSGLTVPSQLRGLKTTYGTEPKYYDQIAWFMDTADLGYSGRAGVVDFAGAVFQEMATRSMTYRVSDHFPLWAEFIIDHSEEEIALALGLDPGMPDPLSAVPN